MSTVTKTHMVIKTNKPANTDKSVLEARAARFKSLANASPSSTSSISQANKPAASKTTDPEMDEKLAKRAARFADVNTAPAIPVTGKVSLNSTSSTPGSVADAEKLAKRAARFADVK